MPPTRDNVLGVLSLIAWALTIIISVKYIVLIMRADNRGEGGILALTALLGPMKSRRPGGRRPAYMMLGLFGTALLYGDGMITPAISVMSAVEGLKVATPVFDPFIVSISIVILIGLFLVQRAGTGTVGTLFGPVMMIWFTVIAALGAIQIADNPGILIAINPLHAVRFFRDNHWHGFIVLGAVFLSVTGGEALYADMGHFGRRPIRLAWFGLVFPSLLLNYFGQGALLLTDQAAAANPFFHLAPSALLYPLVILATLAAIIASQALISGAFSLTRQAVQLGYAPRLSIRHTSAREIGQIYVPSINWLLLVAAIALVAGFRSSSAMAAAYGIAVTGTMAITTILAHRVMRRSWHWHWLPAGLVAGLLLSVDLAFLGANAVKIPDGGWVPLAIGVGGYLLLATWQRGREILGSRLAEHAVPLQLLLGDIAAEPPVRVAGTAVFMSAQRDGVPYTLVYNLRHNHVLHERIILLTMATTEVPRVDPDQRVNVETISEDFFRVTARYGFMEDPDVVEVLEACRPKGLDVALDATSFFVGRETLLSSSRPGMAQWREKLFALMSRNTPRATAAFNVPVEQVIEIGAQIEL